ncbi:NAD(P)/FAD-dependent oxidoreductase [Hydrogenophaga sp.]|jgi:thioredoxin reductase (NADPH)|uniref:NAD(P)/FAD-dependent oxidoreductase n=1 Tax=Hydrogenophaga sp. TaxID=1904254 RepID=UPI0025C46B3D|nr:NAD(P)/FAD-dependent oxidoreductase [Hydrogenophaga sp.]
MTSDERASAAGLDSSDILDCVVVGGGPAGLTAALYLRRFHRRVRVIDAGAGRARKISRSHNVAGFPDGVAGAQLLDLMQRHLRQAGGDVIADTVAHIERSANGLFVIDLTGGPANERLLARNILLCTGVKDRLPPLPGADMVQAADLLRYCPVCDGYEHTGQRIGVIGNSSHGVREAAFLLEAFSSDVWFVEVEGSNEDLEPVLRRAGVRRLAGLARHLGVDHDQHALVTTEDGAVHRFDVLYAGLGVDPRTQLAASLGAALSASGSIVTDAHGRTNIDNLYAAGDVANALDQIGVAVGHAAIAATAIHNSL